MGENSGFTEQSLFDQDPPMLRGPKMPSGNISQAQYSDLVARIRSMEEKIDHIYAYVLRQEQVPKNLAPYANRGDPAKMKLNNMPLI